MTGLNVDHDRIIEIYCMITDGDLNPVSSSDPGWGCAVRCPDSILKGMDEWCTTTHTASGLVDRVRGPEALTPEQAAKRMLAYIKSYIPKARVGMLAGNSVHVDRMFLRAEPFRKVYDHVHYRVFDVSVMGEAVKRWCDPEVRQGEPWKEKKHTAREDILESIEQAKYYKEVVFAGTKARHEEPQDPAPDCGEKRDLVSTADVGITAEKGEADPIAIPEQATALPNRPAKPPSKDD